MLFLFRKSRRSRWSIALGIFTIFLIYEAFSWFHVISWFEDEANLPQKKVYHRPFDDDNPPMVMILSYPHTGADLVGEVFNLNEDAFHIYEPVDGIYSAIYGTVPGTNLPAEILTYTNGSIRSIPEYEREAVLIGINQIQTCEFENMPSEILLNKHFKSKDKQHLVIKPYIYCINKREESCRSHVESHCMKSFNSHLSNNDNCKSFLWFNESVPESKHIQKSVSPEMKEHFTEFWKCQSELQINLQRCLPFIERPCREAMIRSTKTELVNMETAKKLTDLHQNVRIIHVLRDPRGVAYSTQHSHPNQSSFSSDPIKAAEIYCKIAAMDVRKAREINKKNKGTVLQVVFDKFIQDPIEGTARVYDSLDRKMPILVEQLLINGAISKSAYSNATKWVHRINENIVAKIDSVCGDLYKEVDYTWPSQEDLLVMLAK